MSLITAALIFIVLAIAAVLAGAHFGKKARSSCCAQTTKAETEPSWPEENREVETIQEAVIIPEQEATVPDETVVQVPEEEEIIPQAQAEEPSATTPEVPEASAEEPKAEEVIEQVQTEEPIAQSAEVSEVPEVSSEEPKAEAAAVEIVPIETAPAKSGEETKEKKT